jgi:hypothetical protein
MLIREVDNLHADNRACTVLALNCYHISCHVVYAHLKLKP